MHVGLIGVGKMGAGLLKRLQAAGHDVVCYDHNPALSDVADLAELVVRVPTPRVMWVMVPHGAPTRSTVETLASRLSPGDVVIEGGNSHFADDVRHAKLCAEYRVDYLDCGVSGGVWGGERGYGLMVGGDSDVVERCLPVFDALRPPGERAESFVHAGGVGAGHYAKMVHNGIEYGLMQAYGEGYELLQASPVVDDVAGCLRAWTQGTVVRSWLLELLVEALDQTPGLEGISDYTTDSGEGRWALIEGIQQAVPMPVLAAALHARFASRQEVSPTLQAVAALRDQFGGHGTGPRPSR